MNVYNTGALCYVKPMGSEALRFSESGAFTSASIMSLENRTAISEPLQLWHGAAKKVSPSFVMAISVSGECDIRGRQVRKSYESDL